MKYDTATSYFEENAICSTSANNCGYVKNIHNVIYPKYVHKFSVDPVGGYHICEYCKCRRSEVDFKLAQKAQIPQNGADLDLLDAQLFL